MWNLGTCIIVPIMAARATYPIEMGLSCYTIIMAANWYLPGEWEVPGISSFMIEVIDDELGSNALLNNGWNLLSPYGNPRISRENNPYWSGMHRCTWATQCKYNALPSYNNDDLLIYKAPSRNVLWCCAYKIHTYILLHFMWEGCILRSIFTIHIP